jgi:3-dehydroquinate synthase
VLLGHLNLPTRITFDKDAVLEALGKDKKREKESVHFVLLNGLGSTVIADISLAELRQLRDL